MITTAISEYIMLDIETTGLSPDTDAIIELAALKVVDHEVVEEFSTLIDPGVHIPFYTSSINGITDDMVDGFPSVDRVLKEFASFAGERVLAGHNIKRFDLNFIQRDALNYLGREFANDYMDTLTISKRYLPKLGSHSLESLADYYGVSYEGAHRALADCYINKQVYDCLIKEMENPSEAAKRLQICPRCGNLLKKRNGKFGEFLGCAGYPDCKFTRDCNA